MLINLLIDKSTEIATIIPLVERSVVTEEQGRQLCDTRSAYYTGIALARVNHIQ